MTPEQREFLRSLEPTPAAIAAAWRKINVDKREAGIRRLGAGPGAVEWFNAMIEAILETDPDK